jgi:hypothetical protein
MPSKQLRVVYVWSGEARGAAVSKEASRLLPVDALFLVWTLIFLSRVLSNSNRNLLSSPEQSCSSTKDFQLWLRNQTHQVTGFEDFEFWRWALRNWKKSSVRVFK